MEKSNLEGNENAEQRLIRMLKECGSTDPETRQLLNVWLEEQEKLVPKTATGEIEFNLRRGRLYLAAGYRAEALENFEDAWRYARNEGLDKLCEKIVKEMEELGL